MKTPEQCLEAGLATMKERAAEHGGSHTFNKFGEVMTALFPEGITVVDETDWDRMGVLMMAVHKLCRLSGDFLGDKPHFDNAHDLGNYAFILESILRNQTVENEPAPFRTGYISFDGWWRPTLDQEVYPQCDFCKAPVYADQELYVNDNGYGKNWHTHTDHCRVACDRAGVRYPG